MTRADLNAPPETAYIALGSNLDDPLEQLRRARRALAALGEVTGASSLYRTVPVGGPPGQADYLNAVIALKPLMNDPQTLLQALLTLETRQGRTRSVCWAARTLDLDLLAYGNRVLNTPNLTLPHPRLLGRAFVLAPLCDVAPGWRHPVTGENACTVLGRLGHSGVTRTALRWADA